MKLNRSFAITALILLVLLLVRIDTAVAQTEAGDITSSCKISVSSNKDYLKKMTGGNYATYWHGTEGSTITVKVGLNEKAQGVCVYFHGDPVSLRAQDMDGNEIGSCGASFENAYIAFDRTVDAFILTSPDSSEMEISRLQVVGDGDLPAWVQRWDYLNEKADMMLISTHPDDEILWFGGMLPTYSGEKRKKVIVVYMVGGNSPRRKNELLDGLWTCGVHCYPEIGCFPDQGASSYKSVLRSWGEGEAEKRIVEMLRKYRPDVVVTQDIHGEYGHFHHIITVEAAIKAVTQLAEDNSYSPETVALYGSWKPLKLYLHLYREGQIVFNWREPLNSFDGKTSLQVAREAFKKHISQQKGRYSVRDSGRFNSSLFGLYYSAVGDDTIHQDLFENIDE